LKEYNHVIIHYTATAAVITTTLHDMIAQMTAVDVAMKFHIEVVLEQLFSALISFFII